MLRRDGQLQRFARGQSPVGSTENKDRIAVERGMGRMNCARQSVVRRDRDAHEIVATHRRIDHNDADRRVFASPWLCPIGGEEQFFTAWNTRIAVERDFSNCVDGQQRGNGSSICGYASRTETRSRAAWIDYFSDRGAGTRANSVTDPIVGRRR